LRIEMLMGKLRFVISGPTTCNRRNLRPNRGKEDCSFYYRSNKSDP